MTYQSTIDKALADIQPGQTRTLAKVLGGDVQENRWLRASENLDATPPGLFVWQNRPDLETRPRADHHFGKYRGIDSIARPKISYKGRRAQLLDYYHGLDDFFASRRLLEAILRIDAKAIEFVEVDVEVEGGLETYYYCVCTRSLRAIDERRTTTIIRTGLVYFEQDLFAIAPDVSPDVHFFSLFNIAYRLWSMELVQEIVASGAKGMRFWRPFESPWGPNTICI